MIKTELFNTHQFVKDLKAAGMDEKQAEVLAENQLHILETQLATRADIYNMKVELETKIEKGTSRILAVVGVGFAFLGLLVAFGG